jgi:DNA invertase Pin-like site-specific DNA recombinase
MKELAMDTKKAAVYARVSSEKQDTDLSISAQFRAIREYAVKHNLDVVKEFVDEAESGRTADRPAFKEMIAIARRSSKPFNVILVWKYSRFARSREDSIVYKTLLRKHNVQVVSITEPFEDTPTGRLFEAMIESLDEFYSANLGEEIMRGLRESASRGFYVNGYAPYGYTRIKVKDGNKERVKLEPEQHQSEVVKRLFGDALKGKGLKELGKDLQANGIAGPKGKVWGKTTIYHILTNEVYTGTSYWGRVSKNPKVTPVRCENAWPAVVSRSDFDRVQKLLKERAPAQYHPRRTSSKFLLSGLVHCGDCGKALVGTDAKNGKFSYYVCGTLLKRGSGTCCAKYLSAPKFEELVVEKIKQRVLTKENLHKLVNMVDEEMDSCTSDYKKQLITIDAELQEVSHRLGKLFDALETDKLGLNDLAPRIQELRQRQSQLTLAKEKYEEKFSDRKVQLSDLRFVEKYADDLKELLSSKSSLAERRTFIRSFVKDIKVKDNKAELIYTIPLPPSNKANEAEVLSIVQSGSGGWI